MCKQCRGEAPPSPNLNFGSNPGYEAQWLFEAPFPSQAAHSSAFTQENYIDAMTAPPFRSIPGGIKGKVRRTISPWPRLLTRTIEEILTAIRQLGRPRIKTIDLKDFTYIFIRDFDRTLDKAENLLIDAMKEVRRVMPDSRLPKAIDHLKNAETRIRAVRSQLSDRSILRKGGAEYCRRLLEGAIQDIRQAVGLEQIK